MILRFCSGSVTPASRSRNSSAASTNTSGSCSRSNRRRICSASSCRITPLSTKMHVRRSPIARWISIAATVESTPPLRPQTTLPSPDLLADPVGRLFHERRHRPVAGAAADVEGEVAQDVGAVIGMCNLRMEEERVHSAIRRGHRRDRRVGARRRHREARPARLPRSRRGSPRRAAPREPTRTAARSA